MVNKEPILSWKVLFPGLLLSYKQLLGISEILSACQFSPLVWKQKLENAGYMHEDMVWSKMVPKSEVCKAFTGCSSSFPLLSTSALHSLEDLAFSFPSGVSMSYSFFFHSDKLISISKHYNTVKQLRAAIVTDLSRARCIPSTKNSKAYHKFHCSK